MTEARWESAFKLWERIRQKKPDNLRAYISGVEALIRSYRFTEAEALAADMEDRFRNLPKAELFLADLTTRRGRWTEAVECYERIAARSVDLAAQIKRKPEYRQSVLNAYGILEGSRRLDFATHIPKYVSAATSTRERTFVFVSGMPRAGTTALGHLLNIRTDIALFTELHNPYLAYAPSSFAPEIIAAKRRRLPTVASEKLEARAEAAAMIGDKRPLFHYGLPHTVQAMKGASLIVPLLRSEWVM